MRPPFARTLRRTIAKPGECALKTRFGDSLGTNALRLLRKGVAIHLPLHNGNVKKRGLLLCSMTREGMGLEPAKI